MFPGQLRAVIGTDRWRFTLFQRQIQMLPIKKIVIHPEWNSRKAQNDIALVMTTKAITFSNKARPICLPPSEDYNITAGHKATVAGYGFTTDNLLVNVLPSKLQAVEIPIIRMENCRKSYNISRIPITDKMVCAGSSLYGHCSVSFTSKFSIFVNFPLSLGSHEGRLGLSTDHIRRGGPCSSHRNCLLLASM